MADFEPGEKVTRITSLSSLKKGLEVLAAKLKTPSSLTAQQKQLALATIQKIKRTYDESVLEIPKEKAHLEALSKEVAPLQKRIKEAEERLADNNRLPAQIKEIEGKIKSINNKYIETSSYLKDSWRLKNTNKNDADRVRELELDITSLKNGRMSENAKKGVEKELAAAQADLAELQKKHSTIDLNSLPKRIGDLEKDLNNKKGFSDKYKELAAANPLLNSEKTINAAASVATVAAAHTVQQPKTSNPTPSQNKQPNVTASVATTQQSKTFLPMQAALYKDAQKSYPVAAPALTAGITGSADVKVGNDNKDTRRTTHKM